MPCLFNHHRSPPPLMSPRLLQRMPKTLHRQQPRTRLPQRTRSQQMSRQPKKPPEPLMVGSADRIWVEIEMTPKSPAPDDYSAKKCRRPKTASTTSSKPGSSDGRSGRSAIGNPQGLVVGLRCHSPGSSRRKNQGSGLHPVKRSTLTTQPRTRRSLASISATPMKQDRSQARSRLRRWKTTRRPSWPQVVLVSLS